MITPLLANLQPEKRNFWLFVSFLIKAGLILLCYDVIAEGYRLNMFRAINGGYSAGDTPGYLDPVDNLLSNGAYESDYRMPGYGIVYFLFRLALPVPQAMFCLVVTQLLVSVLATYYLARTAYDLTGNKLLFLAVFVSYGLSMRSTYWDFAFLTESLTISLLIFSLYNLSRFLKSGDRPSLLLGGIFFAWIIFLRPIYIPLLGLLFAWVIFHSSKYSRYSFNKATLCGLVFLLPFIMIDTVWVIRNYGVHNRFIPLTKSVYETSIDESYYGNLMDFVIAYGGDRSFWNPAAEIRWFLPDRPPLKPSQAEDPPEYIFTSAFNRDSLVKIKDQILIIQERTLGPEQTKQLTADVKKRLKIYEKSIQREKPWIFYVQGRLKFFRKVMVTTGTDFLPKIPIWQMSAKQLVLKLFNSALNLFSLTIGLVGAVYILLTFRVELVPLALVAGFSHFIYPLVGHLEPRYIVPAFPFLIVSGLYFLFSILDRYRLSKSK